MSHSASQASTSGGIALTVVTSAVHQNKRAGRRFVVRPAQCISSATARGLPPTTMPVVTVGTMVPLTIVPLKTEVPVKAMGPVRAVVPIIARVRLLDEAPAVVLDTGIAHWH